LRDATGSATGVLGVLSRRGLPGEAVLGPGLELVGQIASAQQRGARAEAEAHSARGAARRTARLEALAAFVGGVAHDYNNVLTALLGRVDLARDVLASDHPARVELQAIERISVSAAGLTAQLVAFARPRLEDVGELEVGEVLAGLDPVVRPLLAGRVELAVCGAPERLRVRVDRGQLEQVLVNLVVNARDASPLGGVVRIEVFTGHLDAAAVGELGKLAPGPWVAIAVGDRGPGVAPELAERIFDPFFTTKGPGTGTGLGLATVREIAQTYGGHVAVANNPGGGALFTVYFSRVVTPPVVDRPSGQLPSA
jgi:signal transduction histidine kinase